MGEQENQAIPPNTEAARPPGALSLIWEDLTGHRASGPLGIGARFLFDTAFHLLLSYRLSSHLGRSWLRFLNRPLLYWQHTSLGCYISPRARIGRRVRFPHPVGIVIGEGTSVGDEVSIFQHVTLGSHGRTGQERAYPEIERRARVSAGAVVIGGVRVGEEAVVGANAVVLCDVPQGALAVGVPAQIKERKGAECV